MLINSRLNCSFNPLSNSPLSFATVAALAPKTDIDSVYADVAPTLGATCYFFYFFLPWVAKTATVAKLRGLFCSFFSS